MQKYAPPTLLMPARHHDDSDAAGSGAAPSLSLPVSLSLTPDVGPERRWARSRALLRVSGTSLNEEPGLRLTLMVRVLDFGRVSYLTSG